jgi:hypothetical protein
VQEMNEQGGPANAQERAHRMNALLRSRSRTHSQGTQQPDNADAAVYSTCTYACVIYVAAGCSQARHACKHADATSGLHAGVSAGGR